MADWLWRHMEDNFPQVLGDVNPNNAKIIELFGDQKGH